MKFPDNTKKAISQCTCVLEVKNHSTWKIIELRTVSLDDSESTLEWLNALGNRLCCERTKKRVRRFK
jgi:hypothetical protein